MQLFASGRAACVATLLIAATSLAGEHEFWAAQAYESGTENRFLFEYFATFYPKEVLRLRFLGEASSQQQTGLSLLGAEFSLLIKALRSELTFALQTEYWSDWQVSENRAEAFFTFRPNKRLALSIGSAYRAPQLNVTNFWQALNWPADNAERGLVYEGRVRLLNLSRLSLDFFLADYERMRLYSDANVHYGVRLDLSLGKKWRFLGYASQGVKGVSGLVVSTSQSLVGLGVSYGP